MIHNIEDNYLHFYVEKEFLPVIDNSHLDGTMSQIFDMVCRFDFIKKNGKLFVTFLLSFILQFIKWELKHNYIEILRHSSLHIYILKNQWRFQVLWSYIYDNKISVKK